MIDGSSGAERAFNNVMHTHVVNMPIICACSVSFMHWCVFVLFFVLYFFAITHAQSDKLLRQEVMFCNARRLNSFTANMTTNEFTGNLY